MKKYLVGAAIIALTASGLAIAGGVHMNGHKGGHMVAMLDADNNGQITKAEMTKGSNDMFAKMDVNQDGKLNEADRTAKMAAHFAAADSDKSGELSKAELAAGKGMMHDEGRGHEGRGHHGGAHMLKKADSNNDNAVSKTEFDAAALARFEKLDADKNGVIAANEMPAKHKGKHTHGAAQKPE